MDELHLSSNKISNILSFEFLIFYDNYSFTLGNVNGIHPQSMRRTLSYLWKKYVYLSKVKKNLQLKHIVIC